MRRSVHEGELIQEGRRVIFFSRDHTDASEQTFHFKSYLVHYDMKRKF